MIFEKTYLAGNDFWEGLGGDKNLGHLNYQSVEKSRFVCISFHFLVIVKNEIYEGNHFWFVYIYYWQYVSGKCSTGVIYKLHKEVNRWYFVQVKTVCDLHVHVYFFLKSKT